ncbi:hypothetical protein [Mariniflexile sp.]|uniref:hypothetical protein n=1 Tax=Mariniflexile sp. TaxID=1979402 RepID=UPI004048C7AD
MKLELSTWTHHLNQLLYAYFYFCKKEKIEFNLSFNKTVKYNGAILFINGKRVFFDYSDDSKFIDSSDDYDFYFKRSLRHKDLKPNVHALNFNVPLAYNSHSFLLHLKKDFLTHKPNKTEIIRAIDNFGLFTNSSHGILDIKNYPKEVKDFGGNIIFHTQLWNPDNHPDEDEKNRRTLQNEFRIHACRVLKKNFENVSAGLFSDEFAQKIAPDILLDDSHSKKKNYLKNLKSFNIGIADDGLKDNPGWKIGEYLLFGKAVVTTPLNICSDDFKEGHNYEKLSSRSAYEELPEKIENLLHNKAYLEVGKNNLNWSETYLHPKNYFNRILSVIKVDLIP